LQITSDAGGVRDRLAGADNSATAERVRRRCGRRHEPALWRAPWLRRTPCRFLRLPTVPRATHAWQDDRRHQVCLLLFTYKGECIGELSAGTSAFC